MIIYKQHDSINSYEVLRNDYLCGSFKSIEDLKTEKEKERMEWVKRYNEIPESEKNDRWGMLCLHYAKNAAYAIDTAQEIATDAEYNELEKQTYIKEPKEISKDLYFEMLECLPPCYKEGVKGFYMSEMLHDSYTHNFYKDGNKYFVKVINLKDETTW